MITGGRILVGGADVTRDVRARPAPVPGPRGVDGVPGPRVVAEPDAEDRQAGHRGVHDPRARPTRGAGAGARRAAAGAHRRPQAGAGPLPAPAVGRHAAARRDRHGAGLQPEAAGARRADDRPRRHGRGRGPRPRARAALRDGRGDPADRPQPRRHPLDVRSGRRDVRRQARRAGRRRRGVRGAEAPVHDRAAAVPAPPRRAQVGAGAVHDPGQPPADRHAAADVRVRRPLRAGRRAVPHGGAAVGARRRRAMPTPGPMPPTIARCHHIDRLADRRNRARTTPEPARRADPHRDARRLQDVPPARQHDVPALVGIQLGLGDGETVGLVGESGVGQEHAGQGDARHLRARRGQRDLPRRAPPGRPGPAPQHRRHAGHADGLPEPGQRR